MNKTTWYYYWRILRCRWQHDKLATGVPDCVLIAGRARQQTRDLLYYRRSHRKNFRERCSCYWETVDFKWKSFMSRK